MTLEELTERLIWFEDGPVWDLNQAAVDILLLLDEMETSGTTKCAKELIAVTATSDRLKSAFERLEHQSAQYEVRHELVVSLVEDYGHFEPEGKLGDRLNFEELDWFYSGNQNIPSPVEQRSLGELEELLKELLSDSHSRTKVALERWQNANHRMQLTEIALELNAAGESIEGLEVGMIPIKEVSPDWTKRHAPYKDWVILTFNQIRPTTSSQEEAIERVIALYEKHITPKLEAKYPDKSRDLMVVSRDTILRFLDKKH